MKKNIFLAFPLSLISILSVSLTGLAQQISQNQIEKHFTVTGGSTKGEIAPSVDPKNREINFVSINQGISAGKTWIIIPGWNDGSAKDPTNTTDPKSLKALAERVAKEHPNDRVLMLDWTEASINNKNNSLKDAPGNQTAATWIQPIAKAAVEQLKSIGITGKDLNLIGHSLGSILSAEIGQEYKKNQGVGGKGVNSIVALEPPATTVLTGYIINGENGNKHPTPFRDAAQYSISFYAQAGGFSGQGASVAANPDLAATANNSFLINLPVVNPGAILTGIGAGLNSTINSKKLEDIPGNIGGVFSGLSPLNSHSDVIEVFKNLISDGGNLGFSLDKIDGGFDYIKAGITKVNSGSRNDIRLPGGRETLDEGSIDVQWGTNTPNKFNYVDPKTGAISSITGKTEPYQIVKPVVDTTPTDVMLSGLTGITQTGSSPIGSASNHFPITTYTQFKAADRPVQDELDRGQFRPINEQEKNTYTNGTIVKAPLDIGLTWNQSTKLDLDSHTVTPSGDHVYFSQRGSLNNTPNTFLYRDSIPAAGQLGAEQTRITKFQEGEYRFYIYNFSDQQNLAPAGLSNSSAKVQLFQGGGLLSDIPNDPNVFNLNDPKLQNVGQPYPGTNTFNVPTGQSGNAWYVFKLNTRTGILNRVDRFSNVDSSSNIPKFK
jgi:pimeloyl-ACP methyl ester carboxylesterase